MAVVAAFSIREYTASIRGAAGAEGRRLYGLGAGDLPPMEARRFRWWADELATAPPLPPWSLSPSPSPPPPPTKPSRRTLGKARAPKKRSISDLFAAAPPLALPSSDSGGGGNDNDDDEALCAIMRRAREKKRKRRLQEEEEEEAGAASASVTAAAAAETCDSEGNFTIKEALDKTNLPGGLDTPQASRRPDGVHHARTDEERSPDSKRRKKVKITNLDKNNNKKIDKKRYSESKSATNKVGKQHDLKKMLPLHSILKKYTRHTSVKMVKEKHGDPKGTEVIEVCRKSVKRVKFSEVDDVLGINKQNICKLFSDALASSSSSSTDMSSEGDKHIAAESCSSHMPETATKEASKSTDHEDSLELTSTQLSSNLFDLNEALPESTDLNYPYVSNPEDPNHEPRQHEPLDSDVQVIDEGRQNQQDLSLDSHGLQCQSVPESGLERARSSISPGTFLHGEFMEVSDTFFVGSSRKLTGELAESHGDYAFNLNLGGSQPSNEGEVPPQDCNASTGVASSSHSEMGVQQECRPAAGQTVRLMGKDLSVSTTRGEYVSGTHFYTEDHPTKLFLELPRQGRPYLSLQAQSVPNVSANSASPSQSHIRYTAPQNLSHSFPTTNALSGDRLRYDDRFSYLSGSQHHGNVLLGSPSLTSDANLPRSYGVVSAGSSVHPHNSPSFAFTHPRRMIVEEASGSRRDAACPSRNAENVAARAAIPEMQAQRTGLMKLTPGAKHILMPSDTTGDGTSMPVYSCVSFGSRRGNASATRNMGAELYKL
ncbi:unknown protein [Oryza sativa Japonica Group]|uniref:Uncharacterized protein n=2 Tax=Oryza sativa subsp. japonica TaxID=39947 RepID=Q5QN38_ORYSJ|nr:uncharacterized protein LOC107276816 [Oryza sativa Japonica Group]EAZ10932.1 hypothetical protein OsJ_00775 [Oryza sativa Japonica Group]BAD73170.1 unknown protein [Oryza sativa Japonica Group]